MKPHFDALYAAARRLVQEDSDACDLVQEVSLKAFSCLDEFEKLEHPRAWLLRVLYHCFIDERRSRLRSPLHNDKSSADVEAVAGEAQSGIDPEVETERALRIDRVMRAMDLLDRELCALLAKHDVEGMTIAELAGLTGYSESKIKSRLFRTRAKLGRLLQSDQLNGPKLKIVGGKR